MIAERRQFFFPDQRVRYAKIATDREEHLRNLFGNDYERYFKRTLSLKVKKEVAEDPAQLEQLVLALAEALGAENFARLFDVEQSLTPTVIYAGKPFNRYGEPLSNSKGAANLKSMFKDFPTTLDGEWVLKEGIFYAFDLPDEPGDYDQRSLALNELAGDRIPGLAILSRYYGHFTDVSAKLCRQLTEGVVFKRRCSHYIKQPSSSAETRDWLKRRFVWD